MKRTTATPRKGPTLGDLLDAVGTTPAAIEAAEGVSYSTVYRGLRGIPVTDANAARIGRVVKRTAAQVQAAIRRSAGGKSRRRGAA